MSDHPAPLPDGEEDAFSRAFRERWGDLADRAARLETDTGSQPDPAAASPIHRDPTAPLGQGDTAALPAPSQHPAPPPTYAPGPAAATPDRSAGSPGTGDAVFGAGPLRPGDPLPSYGPPPGQPAQGHARGVAGPSAAALLIVSGVTMAFTMLFVGLPSLVVGAIAAGEDDPEAKARKLRIGWILYAVNWAFMVIGFVLLVVGLFAYVGTT